MHDARQDQGEHPQEARKHFSFPKLLGFEKIQNAINAEAKEKDLHFPCAAMAILTAVSAESTGGISKTVTYCGSFGPFG